MMDISASVIASFAGGASIRQAGREHGLSKQQAYTLLKKYAPDLLATRAAIKREPMDLALVRELTLAKTPRRQIAEQMGFDEESIRQAQIRMGLHSSRPYKRIVPLPTVAEGDEAPFKEPIGAWPAGLQFTDAKVKASIGFGYPRTEQRESYCGCSAAMAEVA